MEQIKKNKAMLALLKQWSEEGDEDGQTETLEVLMKALDEDRFSDRKLFE